MTGPLTTERLVLRRFETGDTDAITAAMQRFEITSMLPRVPWPYTRADALDFLTGKADREDLTFAITSGGALIGAVSVDAHLGYWLLPEYWGRGLATEASRRVLALHFARSDAPLPSGHRLGNLGSRKVLTRLGFADAGQRAVFCNAGARTVTLQDMVLTHDAWKAAA